MYMIAARNMASKVRSRINSDYRIHQTILPRRLTVAYNPIIEVCNFHSALCRIVGPVKDLWMCGLWPSSVHLILVLSCNSRHMSFDVGSVSLNIS
jgi:hypothetical protein